MPIIAATQYHALNRVFLERLKEFFLAMVQLLLGMVLPGSGMPTRLRAFADQVRLFMSGHATRGGPPAARRVPAAWTYWAAALR
ncbi:hypothetical protein [Microvirga massiliensis]|uniref:hypothetical protein n=1 Tax=Microvirga massiliensis TaxID=1033741 RepID=UPI00164DBDA3|nr:hypothetical protein [Microvirga massiliensis]